MRILTILKHGKESKREMRCPECLSLNCRLAAILPKKTAIGTATGNILKYLNLSKKKAIPENDFEIWKCSDCACLWEIRERSKRYDW